MAHVMRAAPEPPLSPQEVHQAIQVFYETIGQPQPSSLDPEAEQPYRLKLLATFGALTGDPDLALLQHMERGVPSTQSQAATSGPQPRSIRSRKP